MRNIKKSGYYLHHVCIFVCLSLCPSIRAHGTRLPLEGIFRKSVEPIQFSLKPYKNNGLLISRSGPGSSVGIAIELRAGRSGIESLWGRDFLPVQTGSGAHPASYKMGTGCFPGVKCGRGVLLTTHPLLVPRSWKSRATPLPTL